MDMFAFFEQTAKQICTTFLTGLDLNPSLVIMLCWAPTCPRETRPRPLKMGNLKVPLSANRRRPVSKSAPSLNSSRNSSSMCTQDHLLKILCGTQGVRLVI